MGFGWKDVFGKIADWIPGREESLRNKVAKLERQRDELLKEKSSVDTVKRLADVLDRLREARLKLRNR